MQKKAMLDNYLLLKTLGTGYTGKVKLGRHVETGELRAIKILDPSKMDTQKLGKVVKSLENELSILQSLSHPNIVKFLELNPKGAYKTKKGNEKHVAYAVIELASKGEIFEVLFKIGPFNENMTRFYMRQLVGALDYLHTNNVAHRDLKPENLLLDHDMNLKLADFGFATIFTEDQKNKTKLGTERYMSPELIYKKPYNAAKVDVFAAGVILFIFYSGHPPFHEGKLEDPYFNVFIKNRQKFWDFHSKQNKKRVYSESFKDLVSNMLEFDPEKRFTIAQVKNSEWLNESCDEARALQDMSTYIQAMMKTIEQSEMVVEDEQNYRSMSYSKRKDNPLYSSKGSLLPIEYEKVATDCISLVSERPNVINVHFNNKIELIDAIISAVNKIPEAKVIWNDAKDAFKIKFTTEYSQTIIAKVKIYQGENKDYSIDILKTQGPCIDFYGFKAKFAEILSESI